MDILENIFDRKEDKDSKKSKELIDYSINIGAFDFLLDNINKIENSKQPNKGKILEKDITFVLGQEPYIEDSSSKRIFSIMKNMDIENKNCIFEVKSDSYKSSGTNKLKKENIKSYTTKNKKNKDHYKNLKFPINKFVNEGNFYSVWIEGALATCEKKIENNNIYWILELGEPFSKKLNGKSISSLKRENLKDIDLDILISSVWYEIDRINSTFADFIVTSNPDIKNYISNEFNINKNKIIENLNPNEIISIETFIPNYKINRLREIVTKKLDSEKSPVLKQYLEYTLNLGCLDFLDLYYEEVLMGIKKKQQGKFRKIIFACGMIPDSGHGGGYRTQELIKAIDSDQKYCAYLRDRGDIDLIEINKIFKNNNIKNLVNDINLAVTSNFKYLSKIIEEKELDDFVLYSSWPAAAMASYDLIARDKNIFWIYETMETFSKVFRGKSLASIKIKKLDYLSTKSLIGTIWFEVERILSTSCNYLVTMTNEENEFLKNTFHIKDEMIQTIPTAYTYQEHTESKSLNNIYKENPKVTNLCFIGPSLHPPNRDSIKWLLEGFKNKKFIKEINNFKIHIIGSWREKDKNYIFKKFPEFKNHIVFEGFVKDLEKYLIYNTDICLLPIVSGSGIRTKLYDYMKSEKPVISTKLGVVGFEVVDNIHCIIRDDKEEYIQSIIDLSKDFEKRKFLGETCKKALSCKTLDLLLSPLRLKLKKLGININFPNKNKTINIISHGFMGKVNKIKYSNNIKLIYGKPLKNSYEIDLNPKIEKYCEEIKFENNFPELRELQIYNYIPNQIINESILLGVINTKIFNLIGSQPDKIFDWLNKGNTLDADVIIFDPYTFSSQLFFNIWDQGEYNHPGIIMLADRLFEDLGLGSSYASNTGRTMNCSSYKNCWIAKPDIFKIMQKFSSEIINSKIGIDDYYKHYSNKTKYETLQRKILPAKVFCFERLFSTLLENNFFGNIKVLRFPSNINFSDQIENIDNDELYMYREGLVQFKNTMNDLNEEKNISRIDFYSKRESFFRGRYNIFIERIKKNKIWKDS